MQFALTSDGTTPGNLYIPNPQTGTFDTFGAVSPAVAVQSRRADVVRFHATNLGTLMVTNLVNQCFGGSSEPWSQSLSSE